MRTTVREVEGITFTSIEDVIKFYEKYESLRVQETKPSWEFLDKLDLRLLEMPQPKIPQGINPLNVPKQRPWIRTEIYFDGSSKSISEYFANNEIRQVKTPQGAASIIYQGQAKQITRTTGKAIQSREGVAELFSRSDAWFNGNATQRQVGNFTMYSIDRGVATQHFLIHPNKDSIFARVTTKNSTGKPHIIAFHFDHREAEIPVPHSVPSLTFELRKTSLPNRWNCRVYFITQCELDIPIANSKFFVSAIPGDTYIEIDPINGTTDVQKISKPYSDILIKQSPKIAQ
ncbi:hypothetical protein DTL42_16915 [Bremerella cremea]|uniref:Uncharacterized protein n=2 Tax=Bremerella cremea TaxID=1031537 RepID=A0A368KRM2_9BACT|nr:hypothetical protein DTL42_16915 [Bremerella cremea]